MAIFITFEHSRIHPYDGYTCQHHLQGSAFKKKLREATLKYNIAKSVKDYTCRHTFATQLIRNVTDIRTVQELVGHADLCTTEIYTHLTGARFSHTTSPLDKK